MSFLFNSPCVVFVYVVLCVVNLFITYTLHCYYIASLVSKVRRKVQSDSQTKTKKESTAAKEWFYKYRVTNTTKYFDGRIGKCRVKVYWPSHPDCSIEARARVEYKLKQVYNSIGKNSTFRSDIVLLVWEEDLQYCKCDSVDDVTDEMVKNGMVKFHTITGDHTTGAIQRHHSEDKENPDYHHIECEIVVCPRTLENRHLAFVFGLVDNQTKKIAESGKPWEIIQSIHNVHEEARNMNISDSAKSDYVKAKLETLSNQHCPGDCSLNTFGTYRVIGGAQRKNLEWNISIIQGHTRFFC